MVNWDRYDRDPAAEQPWANLPAIMKLRRALRSMGMLNPRRRRRT